MFKSYSLNSRVAGTMVAHLSSLWVIACLIPSLFLPLLMHVGKQLAAMWIIKMLADVAPEVDVRECTLHWSFPKLNAALKH